MVFFLQCEDLVCTSLSNSRISLTRDPIDRRTKKYVDIDSSRCYSPVNMAIVSA